MTVAGRVTGDTYATGQTVVVSGIVDGDLLAAAQQVVVDGTVRGDVRAAGAQVTINGVVERSVTAAAQEIDVTSNGRVGGSVVGVGQSVGTFGSIGRGMTIGAETLQIAGPVGGDVLARVENLILTPAASIGGELDYRANRQAETPSGAISGPVQFEPNDQTESDTPPPLNGLFDIGGLIGLVGSALLGVLLIVVAPRLAARTVHEGRQQPLPSLGIGLLALILVPIVAVLVAVTIIGIPISVVLMALYVVALLIAWPVLGLLVGTTLSDAVRRERPLPALVALIVGLIALHLVTHLPWVGGLIAFLGLSIGLGVLLLAIRRGMRTRSEAFS